MKNLNGIGERLRQWREFAGISQREAALVLGINERTYQNHELGKSHLKAKEMLVLVEDYGINLNWLVAGAGEMLLDTVTQETLKKPSKERMPEKFIVTLHGEIYLCNARKVTEE